MAFLIVAIPSTFSNERGVQELLNYLQPRLCRYRLGTVYQEASFKYLYRHLPIKSIYNAILHSPQAELPDFQALLKPARDILN